MQWTHSIKLLLASDPLWKQLKILIKIWQKIGYSSLQYIHDAKKTSWSIEHSLYQVSREINLTVNELIYFFF